MLIISSSLTNKKDLAKFTIRKDIRYFHFVALVNPNNVGIFSLKIGNRLQHFKNHLIMGKRKPYEIEFLSSAGHRRIMDSTKSLETSKWVLAISFAPSLFSRDGGRTVEREEERICRGSFSTG